MTVTNYRRIERRRSARVTLAVPLRVDGQDLSGETFIRRTHSHTISQFGCMIPLEEEIVPGEVLVLMNEHTRQSAQARIVSMRRHRNGRKYVGVEFISPCENFWRLNFVKPGAKALKKTYGSRDA